MTRSETVMRSIPAQIARNFVLWLMIVPVVMVITSPIGDTPLPDAEGWKLIAMFGSPVVFLGAVIDAFAERFSSRGARAYGRGFAFALVIFVLVNADRVDEGMDRARLLKGLLILPMAAAFLAVPQWTREKYLTPEESPTAPVA